MLTLCLLFFQAEDGIRDAHVTGVQTCALPILARVFQQDLLQYSQLSRRSPTIFSAAMENRCSSFILSRFSGCILKLILRTMLTTSSGTVVGGVGFLGNRLS